jgi:hypothetical protein
VTHIPHAEPESQLESETGVFKQEVPSVRLSVESGTERVPQDGRFYVLRGDVVIQSFRSKTHALKAYRDLRDQLLQGRGRESASLRGKEALIREIRDAQFRDFKGGTGQPRAKLRVGGRRGHR